MLSPVYARLCPRCSTPLDPVVDHSATYCSRQCVEMSDTDESVQTPEDMDSPRICIANSGFKRGEAPLWTTSELVRSAIITPLASVFNHSSQQTNPLYLEGKKFVSDITVKALGRPIIVNDIHLDDKLHPGHILLCGTLDHSLFDRFPVKPTINIWSGTCTNDVLHSGVSYAAVGVCRHDCCHPSWYRNGWACKRSYSTLSVEEYLLTPCIGDWAPRWHIAVSYTHLTLPTNLRV